MVRDNPPKKFVVCINNKDYPASLELFKIYKLLTGVRPTKQEFIRVIDESGEDYLYPADYFVPIKLPKIVKQVFSLST